MWGTRNWPCDTVNGACSLEHSDCAVSECESQRDLYPAADDPHAELHGVAADLGRNRHGVINPCNYRQSATSSVRTSALGHIDILSRKFYSMSMAFYAFTCAIHSIVKRLSHG
jgi:hypothetical protein